jgi:hypothetical protein
VTEAGTLSAGVAVAAEELGHLGLKRGLQHEADRQAGDLLEDLAEVTVEVGEQAIELGPDTVSGGYSLVRHGRTPERLWKVFRNLRPCCCYTEDGTPPVRGLAGALTC